AGSTCGTTARGLSTYRHSTATTASTNLQNIMHDTMYDHIESLWFPGWTVRGKNVTNFGENSQTNLGTGLPGFLIEGLFHDNQADTTGYADPRFRNDYARAIVQGVINYFEDRDGITLTNPPETPRNLRAISTGGGNVQITWDAPLNSSNDVHFGGAATSYIVYRSSNGFGFDNGTTVASGTTLTVSGVPADAPTYFRVAAVNAGGISFPTETLAASDGDIKALIVNGFDRNERSLVPTQTITNAGTDLRRLDPRRFQAFNYSVEHANSLAPLGIQISGSSNEAVASGAVNLGDYDLVFWILGEESTTDETLSTAEQTAVANYLALGDRGFFISGAEIGWDLDSQGTTGDRTFFNGTLRADYVGDDAGTYTIASTATGPFAGISSFNFDVASGARYDAEYPDRLTTSSGSTVALTYSGGTADTAAVAYDGTSRVLVFGFPFETIASAAKRDEVMAAAVTFLLPDAPSAPSALSATTNSQTQIDLSWTDNSSNETGFIIARSTTSGGPYTDIFTTAANATSYSNTGLTANTTYYYVVRATASVGDSSNSAQASATTLPNAPAAPSGLSATAASQTQINLSWTDNSSNETGFIIARSTTSGGPYTDIFTTAANATSYSNTGLTANTTYYYVVRATNTGGSSANSAQASATTPPNIPSAPSGLSATAASSSQINLSWTDNSSNETGFIIARSNVSGGPYTDIYTTAANATSYSNTSLNAITPYYYVVRATNASGSSANSSQASATTLQADRISGGSFEGTFVGGVGPGWTSWTASGSAAIGFGRATINKQDGAASQYWNRADTSAVDGGVYQTINVIPGGTYQITGWMKRQSTFTGSFIRVGYDLTGGTNGTAASVTYTDITGTDNTWNQYSQSVVATGNTMTIFARGGHTSTSGGTNAYYYFDAVTVIGPGANLSANGSMEGTYVSGVAPSWTSFTTSGTPTFGRASINHHDGAYSQYWNRSDTAAFDGGVRQTITTVPGQAYTISGWMKRQSTLAGTTMRMGYDLTGGTNPSAGTVVYTDITGGTNNVWVQYTANVVATGTSITVFARGGHTGTTGGSTAYFYVDEIKVYVP
ncbi:fibronectin type III domain-containing protein, partial [Candidatus Sumerlaeota bacterium]|nr:fibronectin type III domain-containing protein [Candidatus Sumerlaeota bacterium]